MNRIIAKPEGVEPLHRQVYRRLVSAIASGALAPGCRVLSSREMAREMNVSRNTVVLAFEQLITEGHLVAVTGSGTFVAGSAVPTQAVPEPAADVHHAPDMSRVTAQIARLSAEISAHVPVAVPFRPFFPALKDFPLPVWQRISTDVYHRLLRHSDLMGENDPAGYLPLREEIARQMMLRGVRCTAHNVIIVDGTQQGVDIACRLLLHPGDAIWCEDPGYPGVRISAGAIGARVVDVPVDGAGMVVKHGMAHAGAARVAYVTPGNQMPIGAVMSAERRAELLAWARAADAWIIEDGYDSDLRFDGTVSTTIQALDGNQRVIYLNTFTKTLFPALRLGYAIVPDALADAFVRMRQVGSRFSPFMAQAVVAEFMRRGLFARHLRNMRAVYAHRHAVLQAQAARHAAPWLRLRPAVSGMQVSARIRAGIDTQELILRAAEDGLMITPVTRFSGTHARDYSNQVMLGFGEFDDRALASGMQALGRLLSTSHDAIGPRG
jgi:GntR family transcriptional regulator/MocR family aminotransferase